MVLESHEATTEIVPLLQGKLKFIYNLHWACNDLCSSIMGFHPKIKKTEHLQVIQNRVLRLIVRYDWYMQIGKMHLDTKISKSDIGIIHFY